MFFELKSEEAVGKIKKKREKGSSEEQEESIVIPKIVGGIDIKENSSLNQYPRKEGTKIILELRNLEGRRG